MNTVAIGGACHIAGQGAVTWSTTQRAACMCAPGGTGTAAVHDVPDHIASCLRFASFDRTLSLALLHTAVSPPIHATDTSSQLAFSMPQTFADDIGILANDEKCDVIVDDVFYFRE